MRVICYVRVSTEEQAVSGAGLEAQRRAIIAECRRRGWELVETIEDAGYSAEDLKRPGVQEPPTPERRRGAGLVAVAPRPSVLSWW
jgi:DNA invertase Pin-like site-specific DNA recombinase